MPYSTCGKHREAQIHLWNGQHGNGKLSYCFVISETRAVGNSSPSCVRFPFSNSSTGSNQLILCSLSISNTDVGAAFACSVRRSCLRVFLVLRKRKNWTSMACGVDPLPRKHSIRGIDADLPAEISDQDSCSKESVNASPFLTWLKTAFVSARMCKGLQNIAGS